MTLMLKKDYPIKWIPVKDLSVVWPEAQRSRREAKVEAIKKKFDPDAFGVIAVTLPNGKGVYHVIDGQHRTQAVREMWGDNERVPCMVLNGRTRAEAAHIWSLMNSDRTMPQAIDRFLVAVTAGYDDEVAVNDILTDMGYRVAASGDDGVISAVSSCLKVYRHGGEEALTWALGTIQETWGMARDSVHGGIVRAYADLLDQHPTVDRKRLVNKVAKEYTPARLIGAARTAREMFKGTVHANIVRILAQTYNHGLRTGARLEES